MKPGGPASDARLAQVEVVPPLAQEKAPLLLLDYRL